MNRTISHFFSAGQQNFFFSAVGENLLPFLGMGDTLVSLKLEPESRRHIALVRTLAAAALCLLLCSSRATKTRRSRRRSSTFFQNFYFFVKSYSTHSNNGKNSLIDLFFLPKAFTQGQISN